MVCPVFAGSALLIAHLGFSVLILLAVLLLPQGGDGLDNMYPWGALLIGALCLPCLTLLAAVVLEYCCSIDRIQQQVRNFTVAHAVSGCCAAGHVNQKTGEPILCDREIILRCIVAWFGSLSTFEDTVQGEVGAILVHQLAHDVFSYSRIVQVTSPIMLGTLDRWCSRVAHDGRHHVEIMIALTSTWLVFIPTLCLVLLQVAHKMRRACRTRLRHLMLGILLTFVGIGAYAGYAVLEVISRHFIQSEAGCSQKRLSAITTQVQAPKKVAWLYLPGLWPHPPSALQIIHILDYKTISYHVVPCNITYHTIQHCGRLEGVHILAEDRRQILKARGV